MVEEVKKENSYISGLDGFRGLLVLSVFVFHIFLVFYPENLDYFSGGFLAVESFFVLSGYLITKSLLRIKQKDKGLFKSYLLFLKSRMLRLLPSFLFLVSLELIVFYYIFPHKFNKIISEVIFGTLDIYNWWLIFNKVPYFERFNDLSYNLHFWSLSIEWQFYIIWGLVFLVLIKYLERFEINLFITILIFISLFAMFYIYKIYENIDRVYFGSDTRIFSFLFGSLLAINEDKFSKDNLKFGIVGFIALVLLILSYFYLNNYNDYMYSFGFLFVSLVSTILILSITKSDYLNKSISVLSILGKRSYSIYLWHYPIFAFVYSLFNNNNNIEIVITAVILSLLISNVNYYLIEETFRKLNFEYVANLKVFLNLSLSSIGVGILIGYLANVYTISNNNKISEKVQSQKNAVLVSYDNKSQLVSKEIEVVDNKSEINKADDETTVSFDTEKFSGGNVSGDIFLVGDSVLLSASKYLKDYLPNSYIDAKVGRQFKEVFSLIEEGKLKNYNKIVIALGNNGYVRKSDVIDLIEKLKDKEIYFVTVKVPKPWQNQVNSLYREIVNEYPNVKVVDWYSYSHDKNEIFVEDKVHLNQKGIKIYASLLKNTIFSINKNSKNDKVINNEENIQIPVKNEGELEPPN